MSRERVRGGVREGGILRGSDGDCLECSSKCFSKWRVEEGFSRVGENNNFLRRRRRRGNIKGRNNKKYLSLFFILKTKTITLNLNKTPLPSPPPSSITTPPSPPSLPSPFPASQKIVLSSLSPHSSFPFEIFDVVDKKLLNHSYYNVYR